MVVKTIVEHGILNWDPSLVISPESLRRQFARTMLELLFPQELVEEQV